VGAAPALLGPPPVEVLFEHAPAVGVAYPQPVGDDQPVADGTDV